MRSARGVILLVLAACGSSAPARPTTPGTHPDRPSREECVAVVDRLRTILPEHFPDPEKDVADCLALPRPVVECLGRADGEAALDACVRDFCRERRDRCPRADLAPRPTETECAAAVARVLALRGTEAAVDEATRQGLVAECVARAAWADVACTAAAADLPALDRCANDSSRAIR